VDAGGIANDLNSVDSFDAVILGAGISGLVSASILASQGTGRIALVDEFAHVGGNHIDCSYGSYTFDVGSFIFQDDSPLLKHFPELLPRYIPILPTWGKLNPRGKVAIYPISIRDDIAATGLIEWGRMVASVAFARLFQRRTTNAKEFARYWVGARFLRQSGLEHYLERFFGVPADEVDIKFAKKRMLWISEHATVNVFFTRLLKRSKAPRKNRQLARPREGFSYLYEAAVQRLERTGVTLHLGAEMQSLKRNGQGFVLNLKDRDIRAKRVISTIPIERAQALCGVHAEKKLNTVTLISLFYSFSGDRRFPYSILYNFSFNGAWKRLTVYSDFYDKANGREFFAVEVIASQVGDSIDAADRDFRRHVQENGLFLGDLRLEGSRTVSNAYPVYTNQSGERAEQAIGALKAFGIESFGRQGGFDYQPTARVSTMQAETMLQRG
jgi:protoporphyrinogen oxidase